MPLKLFAALAAIPLVPAAVQAADFVTIPLEATIDAPADVAWAKVSGFCQIGVWFKTTCEITSGTDGQVGAVRRIAGRVDELIVAKTASSYTYSQPKSPIDYHGTVEIRPVDAGHSKLLYTLVYDADALPKSAPENKAADREARTKIFTAAVAAIKAQAEAK
ncbi:SRPBCC family protein [Asticcacaulis solisilvae]|uniref:SRPBCC family protein n=1 Tax=Asticcacaulis solisilvae TaxID=1217274 RepID=UPI003FD7E8D0